MLDAQQLETAGFGSKTASRRFPFESPEGDFVDEARNFSCRICSIENLHIGLLSHGTPCISVVYWVTQSRTG